MKRLSRELCLHWAKSLVAPGYLYQFLDKYSAYMGDAPLWKTLKGGKKIKCNLADTVHQQIYFWGAYEPIECYLICQIAKKGMTIVDAGANIGFYSLMFSNVVAENGKVFSFEPVPHNYQQFQENLDHSQNVENVQLILKGLWNKTETLTFSLDESMDKNAGSFTAGKVQSAFKQFSCHVTTLDEFVDENRIEKIDIIKMDIEGAELNALRGAENVLRKDHPIILLEVCDYTCASVGHTPDDLWNYLKQFDYKIFEIASTFERCKKRDDFRGIKQSNVILYHGNLPEILQHGWDYKQVKKSFMV